MKRCEKCNLVYRDDFRLCPRCGDNLVYIGDVGGQSAYDDQDDMKMQMIMRQYDDERQNRQRELDDERHKRERELSEKQQKYREQCEDAKALIIKKWSSSWIILVLSIVTSVQAILATVNAITTVIKGFSFGVVSALVGILLSGLACSGFWRAYSAGKKPHAKMDPGGVKTLRSVFKFYWVVIIMAIAGMLFLIFMMFSIKNNVANNLGGLFSLLGIDVTELYNAGVNNTVILLVIVLVVAVLIIICCAQISKFANKTVELIETQKAPLDYTTMFAVIVFFIVGGAYTVITLLSFALEQTGENVLISILKLLISPKNVLELIGNIASAICFIFGGIHALTFNSIGKDIENAVASVPVPCD